MIRGCFAANVWNQWNFFESEPVRSALDLRVARGTSYSRRSLAMRRRSCALKTRSKRWQVRNERLAHLWRHWTEIITYWRGKARWFGLTRRWGIFGTICFKAGLRRRSRLIFFHDRNVVGSATRGQRRNRFRTAQIDGWLDVSISWWRMNDSDRFGRLGYLNCSRWLCIRCRLNGYSTRWSAQIDMNEWHTTLQLHFRSP